MRYIFLLCDNYITQIPFVNTNVRNISHGAHGLFAQWCTTLSPKNLKQDTITPKTQNQHTAISNPQKREKEDLCQFFGIRFIRVLRLDLIRMR